MEHNHNADFYPTWPNTGDYAATAESFGTAPIHSTELGAAHERTVLAPEVAAKFTSDRRYLCRKTGIPAPAGLT